MSRKKKFSGFGEPDERVEGSVRFADPSTGTMTSRVHAFNEPESNVAAFGEASQGVRSIDRWTNGEEIWRRMGKKRGVISEQEEE